MSKIHILEDDDNRYRKFKKWFLNNYQFSSTAKDCIDKIKSDEELEYLFLDHDLSYEEQNQDINNGNKNTGMEVVRFLCENHQDNIKLIIVHSLNAVAAKNMVFNLMANNYNVQYVPFSTMTDEKMDKFYEEIKL